MIRSHHALAERESNFELLRIVAMFLIVAHHFAVHGRFDFPTDTITLNRLWIQFILLGGKIGVNVFVLISGYFLIDEKNIRISKILKLWIQLIIYSVGIYILFLIIGVENFRIDTLIKALFPITYRGWWFASTYFVLYILSPFMNIFLKTLNRKLFGELLVIIFIFWCIIPTFTNQSFESNDLLWFMYLYALAAYIKLWLRKDLRTSRFYIMSASVITLMTFMSAVLMDFLGLKIRVLGVHATHFYGMQCVTILTVSVLLFIGFTNFRIKSNKVINTISTTMFGVYLIHDNDYIRQFLWVNVFKNSSYSESVFLIPYSIGVICFVFAVCICVELIRIYLVEKKYMKFINSAESVLIKKLREECSLEKE